MLFLRWKEVFKQKGRAAKMEKPFKVFYSAVFKLIMEKMDGNLRRDGIWSHPCLTSPSRTRH